VKNGLSFKHPPETEESNDRFGGRTVGWDRVKVLRRELSPVVQGNGFAGGSDKAEGGT
jgi:hypothetical protein